MADIVLRNQFWLHRGAGRPLRVMAMAEGWIMVRHKGAGPFLLTERELRAGYVLDSDPKRAAETVSESR